MRKDTGGPAFPVSTGDGDQGHQDGPSTWQHAGLSIRDYLAAKAMQGMMVQYHEHWTQDGVARTAYAIADEMLLERAK